MGAGGLRVLPLVAGFLLLAGAALAAPPARLFPPPASTADHTRFEALKRPFSSPEEVTRACLSCHNLAGEQVGKTLHFTWTWPGRDGRTLGKAHVINNF